MTLILWFTLVGMIGMAIALFQMRTQPKGLYILFFAEMWERFSYYGMRALLIFYLTQHFLFGESEAYGIYGSYVTLVYITPVIGGYLADKFMGQRLAVAVGAAFLVAGHAGMAIEGPPTPSGESADPFFLNVFFLSLTLITIGVGFLKGNISAIVGQLYPKTDKRRDGAFTLFYVGINLGSFFGALWAGYLGQTFGWSYGFGLAGIGMALGLIVFILGKPLLQGAGELSDKGTFTRPVAAGLSPRVWIGIGTVIVTLLIWLMIRDQQTVGVVLGITGAVTVGYILWRSVFTLEAHARDRIFAALILIIVQILFWALFEQAGSSLNIYTDEQVDRTLFGTDLPAAVFQSLNAFYIVYLGPILAAIWVFLAKRGLEPSAPVKFGLGLCQVGLGFLVLVWGANAAPGLTPVIFIFLIYLLHTTGELCLSPVGLSAMTRLSVPSMVGLIMGTWFLASAAGNFASSVIAQLTVAEDGSSGPEQVLAVYSNVGWLGIGVGVAMILVSPAITWLMHLKTLKDDHDPQPEMHPQEGVHVKG